MVVDFLQHYTAISKTYSLRRRLKKKSKVGGNLENHESRIYTFA